MSLSLGYTVWPTLHIKSLFRLLYTWTSCLWLWEKTPSIEPLVSRVISLKTHEALIVEDWGGKDQFCSLYKDALLVWLYFFFMILGNSPYFLSLFLLVKIFFNESASTHKTLKSCTRHALRNFVWDNYNTIIPGANMQKGLIFKNLLISHTCGKTKCMVFRPMKPSSETVKFSTPGSGVQVLRRSKYGDKVKLY